ncbi:uncharacterized protein N7500_002884 [Penicillium coprophilum]|uniref:uncharacterized protein n=1 Tax=Penicillium coprophilum TaxID=36646 RepID=UPI0023A5C295|nr:uncharacterized protein N7500_002884 [Penicillium coprophilum]KAJ5170101.1 hypothetical protein N7500_002884 [Penicillium coprophilum]
MKEPSESLQALVVATTRFYPPQALGGEEWNAIVATDSAKLDTGKVPFTKERRPMPTAKRLAEGATVWPRRWIISNSVSIPRSDISTDEMS